MSTQLSPEVVELVAEFLERHPKAPHGPVGCLETALRSYETNLAYHKRQQKSLNEETRLWKRALKGDAAAKAELRKLLEE